MIIEVEVGMGGTCIRLLTSNRTIENLNCVLDWEPGRDSVIFVILC